MRTKKQGRWPMGKTDKSLEEVLGWKDKVYQEYNEFSPEEYIQKMKNNAEKLLSANKIELKEITLERKHRKIA
jgi:hypothetical protein